VPAAIGLVIGLTGAALSTRVIARLLFNTSPTDAATFAAVTILLGVGACLAAWLPARRAARVDPVRALAGE
jgi:putative ABC transport system permease protein